MQKMNGSTNDNADQPEVIPIGEWLATVWNARRAVAVITVLTMVACYGWAKLHATYKSEGFFQFGGPIPAPASSKHSSDEKESAAGITLPDYKRYAASFTTSERFAEYVTENKIESAAVASELAQVFASRSGIGRMIEPIYPYTKLDAKDLMDQPKGNNNVVGLRISYEADSPQIAQQAVAVLSRYVMDSIVYFIYSDVIRFKQAEIKTEITKLDNTIINQRIQLAQFQRRADDLRKIVASNPVAANSSARQVIEITEDTARYLPPRTLLTTTQVQISEANEAILNARLEQRRNLLFLEYYDGVRKILDTTKSGETLLRSLDGVKRLVFKDKNLQDDSVKEIYNTISVENETAINLYLDRSRFIAGPTLPRHSSSRPSFAFVFGALPGFFLSLLFLFGRYRWRQMRSTA